MTKPRYKAPQNLQDWLAVATAGLVPSAQTRVRAEIETHCADAVQTRMADGLPEAAAQALALADLGDARKAAKDFSRQYLTEVDFKHFQKSFNFCQSLGVSTFYMAAATALFMCRVFSHPRWNTAVLVLLGLCWAGALGARFAAWRLARGPAGLNLRYRMVRLSLLSVYLTLPLMAFKDWLAIIVLAIGWPAAFALNHAWQKKLHSSSEDFAARLEQPSCNPGGPAKA